MQASKTSQVDAHVGRRMRQRREYLGISQSRLGQHLGLTFSQVQKYENGSNRIGAGRLYLMARILQVPVQYFYEGLGSRPGFEAETEGPKEAELTMLDDAFLSIPDPDTRASLIALVRSLAEQGGAAASTASRAGARRLRRAEMI
ncbi:helix-turn-helix transcriptional regulator [Amaricoccus solimangrovi]|uniref:Helix-turn-helix transcriptional regulator n=2 Tax=Amaricoccus solimangrovi TaxID=2589815 RepID=A0A501WWU9_9RHOB|nr:helix-turn-helix transcriptional regulator [Amaricoccus solimangrovi]